MEGLWLATAGDDIKLWDCDHGFSLLHTFNPHCNRNIASVAWNSEGSLLASCALESEQVTLTYTKNALLTSVELPCGAGVQCIDFSSASRFLLCGGAEGVSVWDLKTKALKKSFQEHKGPVTTACYNWNNSYIASGSETGEIILHNTLTGQSSSPLVAPSVQAIRQLEYSAFKKSMFGTASDDGAVTLWDANTRRLLHSFRDAHVGPTTGLAFSPINEMLMMSVGLDKRFVCYDIQRKHILKVFDAQSPLTCIDIMPDGATAAVGSTRGKVYIYDLRQGGSTPIHIFQAHKTSVHSVKFMPVAKSKSEESSAGSKTGVSSVSSTRRQLPSAPAVMQDITPSKTGQTVDADPIPQAVSPALSVDVFSPTTTQGNQSQNHSKSASHINLTASRGEDSHAGVFSPLTKGGELSAVSQIGIRDSSLLSLPSFLGQNNSNVHSSATEHLAHHSISNAAKHSAMAGPTMHHSLTSQQQGANILTGHLSQNVTGGHLSQNVMAGHLSQNVTAGHLSHLQESGTVHSPVVGQLSHPQMCSSLQNSEEEGGPQGAGHGPLQSAGVGPSASCAGVMRNTAPSVRSQKGRVKWEAHDRSTASSSDSAAISGGEEGELGGLSPGRNSSPSSSSILGPHPRSGPAMANGTACPAAGPVEVGASGEVGATQREFLRSLVADAMEEVRDDLHRDIQGLHVSMLRQFHNFEREMQTTLSHYAEVNQKLLLYVRQLEEENRRLKKNY